MGIAPLLIQEYLIRSLRPPGGDQILTAREISNIEVNG